MHNPALVDRMAGDAFSEAFARIECHYFTNAGFFDDTTALLKNVHKIKTIPGVIVQGRYDVVCPMASAWDLHHAWPEADFRIVPDSGHSAFEAGITHELLEATDRFRGSSSKKSL
jgi:proline iminopeptidase